MRDIMGNLEERKDGGFVLVWALLLMVVLLILGVSGIGTSIFESEMTANDALHKQSFFQSDGGANVAAMLIEENVSCPGGFSNALILNNVKVNNLSLYKNLQTTDTGTQIANNRIGLLPIPAVPVSDTPTGNGPSFAGNGGRDAYYFYNTADATGNTLPRTNLKTYGITKVLPGGSMLMAAGYEGKGKGIPGGGATIDYDTFSQYFNVRQSQSIVEILWQHIVGFEGTCNY